MKKFEQMPCARCGEVTAMSAEQLASIRAEVSDFPPLVAGVCPRCMMKDPAMKAEMDAWIAGYKHRLVGKVRGALVRPLEVIDRFVEGLK